MAENVFKVNQWKFLNKYLLYVHFQELWPRLWSVWGRFTQKQNKIKQKQVDNVCFRWPHLSLNKNVLHFSFL